MNLGDIASLPPTVDTPTAAEMFGCSTSCLWALVREGKAPIEPLRLGRKLRWPTAPLLELLGIDTPTSLPSARALRVVEGSGSAR